MRFTLAVVAAISGFAVAAPAAPSPVGGLVPVGSIVPVGGLLSGGDLVGELTGVVSQVENGLGAEDLEKKLDTLLGGALAKVEAAMGQPLAHKLISLVQGGLPPQVVQAVGQGIALVEQGVAIQTVDAYVKGQTDGAITSLEQTIGVTNIQKILQI